MLSVLANGASSPASAGVVYLGMFGQVLDSATLVNAPLFTLGYAQLEQAVTIPAGVASVQVVLSGFSSTDLSASGTVSFDDVGLFER